MAIINPVQNMATNPQALLAALAQEAARQRLASLAQASGTFNRANDRFNAGRVNAADTALRAKMAQQGQLAGSIGQGANMAARMLQQVMGQQALAERQRAQYGHERGMQQSGQEFARGERKAEQEFRVGTMEDQRAHETELFRERESALDRRQGRQLGAAEASQQRAQEFERDMYGQQVRTRREDADTGYGRQVEMLNKKHEQDLEFLELKHEFDKSLRKGTTGLDDQMSAQLSTFLNTGTMGPMAKVAYEGFLAENPGKTPKDFARWIGKTATGIPNTEGASVSDQLYLSYARDKFAALMEVADPDQRGQQITEYLYNLPNILAQDISPQTKSELQEIGTAMVFGLMAESERKRTPDVLEQLEQLERVASGELLPSDAGRPRDPTAGEILGTLLAPTAWLLRGFEDVPTPPAGTFSQTRW